MLCSLSRGLKDLLNYGLFQPASNGRDGKFLDEERMLREYPQPISKGVPSLEVSQSGGPVLRAKPIRGPVLRAKPIRGPVLRGKPIRGPVLRGKPIRGPVL